MFGHDISLLARGPGFLHPMISWGECDDPLTLGSSLKSGSLNPRDATILVILSWNKQTLIQAAHHEHIKKKSLNPFESHSYHLITHSRDSNFILVGGFNHLERYEFVNGKDDIPYMKWKIKNVWNHQPVSKGSVDPGGSEFPQPGPSASAALVAASEVKSWSCWAKASAWLIHCWPTATHRYMYIYILYIYIIYIYIHIMCVYHDMSTNAYIYMYI